MPARVNREGHQKLLASATHQKLAQDCIAVYCYASMNNRGRMGINQQKEYLFNAYHGKAGLESAISLFLNGEGRFAAFWEGSDKVITYSLPGNLNDKYGNRLTVKNFTEESVPRSRNSERYCAH